MRELMGANFKSLLFQQTNISNNNNIVRLAVSFLDIIYFVNNSPTLSNVIQFIREIIHERCRQTFVWISRSELSLTLKAKKALDTKKRKIFHVEELSSATNGAKMFVNGNDANLHLRISEEKASFWRLKARGSEASLAKASLAF